MKYLAVTFCVVSFAACAQPAPSRPPAPNDCVDLHEAPDYVPGVDVQGRAVAPADLPSDSNLAVNTDVFAEVRTANRQLPSIGVEVDASGLNPKPPCQVVPEGTSQPEPAH